MKLRCDRLAAGIIAAVPGVRRLGDPAARAPGLLVLAFEGVQSEVLLHALEARGVLASAGSACHSTRRDPPRCLVDAGVKSDEGAIRFSLSVDTTDDEIEAAVSAVIQAVRDLRAGHGQTP
jgi:cysteine desulfurase